MEIVFFEFIDRYTRSKTTSALVIEFSKPIPPNAKRAISNIIALCRSKKLSPDEQKVYKRNKHTQYKLFNERIHPSKVWKFAKKEKY